MKICCFKVLYTFSCNVNNHPNLAYVWVWIFTSDLRTLAISSLEYYKVGKNHN